MNTVHSKSSNKPYSLKKRPHSLSETTSSLKIMERDLKIFNHIATYGFATGNELFKFFGGIKKESKYHTKRLLKLKRSGYIDSLESDFSSHVGYILKPKAYKILKSRGFNFLPYILKKDKYRGSYRHSVVLKKVQSIFLKSPLINDFIPEHQVKKWLNLNIEKSFSEGDKVPDGLFSLSIDESIEKVALELELSLKAKQRYEDIFRKHLTSADWSTVYYIVSDEKMRQKLLSYLQEFGRKVHIFDDDNQKNYIYFSLLDEFLEKGLKAQFCDNELSFSLKSLE